MHGGGHRGHRRAEFPVEGLIYRLVDTHHAQAYPYREEVEGSRECVVALAHLEGRHVEVDHHCDAGHEEHQEVQPASALVPSELDEESYESQEEGEEVVVVLPLVLRQYCGGIALIPQAPVVDELHAALPVPVEDVSGGGAVNLILTAYEVPHEVSPIHPSQLEIEEVGQVRTHGGFGGGCSLHLLSLSAGVGLVEVLGVLVDIAPHPGEEHLPGRVELLHPGAVDLLVLPVERGPVLGLGHLEGGVEVLPVDEGSLAVLLAREIAD